MQVARRNQSMTVTWREDEPRLTAAGVEAAGFPRTPWGRRGYDEAAVNGFLDQVRAELVMLANEKTGLMEEVIRLRRRFIARDGAGEWLADAGEAHAMAVAIVSEAQVTADRYVADAQEYSARLTQDASERREAMLAEAEQVLADARAQARWAASAAMEAPVPEQAAGPLRAARASDAYARTFNRVYLTNAVVLAEALLKMLGDWKQHEASDGQHQDMKPTPAA
jgi:DivIVA domain-containing protein